MPKTAHWPVAIGLIVGGVILGRYGGDSRLQGQAPTDGAPIPRELTSYRDLVKHALPAVVSIDAKTQSRRGAIFPGGRPDGDRENTLGAGSGVIVDASGVIVTNNHVVDAAESLEIVLNDGRKFTTKDYKRDPNSDLAVVRVKSDSPLPYLPFGDSSQMEIGDRVLAIGSPFGLKGTVTHGIISAKGRDLKLNRYDDFLQTDAAINPGNSGGPLINLSGQVIGINSAIKTAGSGGFQGVGLAIPSNMAKKIMTQLLKDGVVKRGYFGVTMYEDFSPEIAALLGAPKGGAAIATMEPNSPASKGGLLVDDVVTSINGQPIREQRELIRVVGESPVGEAVDVELLRDGKPVKLKVSLGELPSVERGAAAFSPVEDAERVAVRKAGLNLIDAMNRNKDGAAAVATANGIAAGAGVQPGMYIVRVNRKPVASAEEAKSAIESGDLNAGVLVHVQYRTRSGQWTSRLALLKSRS
ncbi:MAG: trypsin-like peptidase domain-containing protein [Gemmataceae bacterium]